jgi:hypothetical protein
MTIPRISTDSATEYAQILRRRTPLRAQAEAFVAQTFFAPMFRMMRDSPFRSDVFSGGQGGRAFGSMLDGVLAERMGRGAGAELVDSIVKTFDPEVVSFLSRRTPLRATPTTGVSP